MLPPPLPLTGGVAERGTARPTGVFPSRAVVRGGAPAWVLPAPESPRGAALSAVAPLPALPAPDPPRSPRGTAVPTVPCSPPPPPAARLPPPPPAARLPPSPPAARLPPPPAPRLPPRLCASAAAGIASSHTGINTAIASRDHRGNIRFMA